MPAEWAVQHWPLCSFHVFLSHCAEDRGRLIVPVQQRVESGRVITWLDRHDYPTGRDPFEVLREEVLRCRHIVYFVTEALLRQGRGWSAIERGCADVVQRAFTHGSLEVCHIELPLIFVSRDNPVLNRSIWALLLPKAVFYPGKPRSIRDRIAWAATTISSFVRQEEQWGADIGTRVESDRVLSDHFGRDSNMFDRLIGASPLPVGV